MCARLGGHVDSAWVEGFMVDGDTARVITQDALLAREEAREQGKDSLTLLMTTHSLALFMTIMVLGEHYLNSSPGQPP